MDKMLLAQFVPEEVLPSDLSGPLDVRIEDQSGGVLAQTKALVAPIPIDENQSATVPFGMFTMSFTGGAEVRRDLRRRHDEEVKRRYTPATQPCAAGVDRLEAELPIVACDHVKETTRPITEAPP
jgi:hypothetical protein